MGYIAYLDLLGTKDFAGDPDVYSSNITIFYREAKTLSHYLKDAKGRIGIFSDCLYAECADLEAMLNFIVALRGRLTVQQLFFNAAITCGDIGVVNQAKSDNDNFFGVAFEKSDIARVYMKHNKFKGIGIWVDEEIVKDLNMKKTAQYEIVRSVYVQEMESQLYVPYYDVAFKFDNRIYDCYEDECIKVILNSCLLAYAKSKKYGKYYLSILATLINSHSDYQLQWDNKNRKFRNSPLIYHIIMKLAADYGKEYPEIQGIEVLCLLIINNAFSNKNITGNDRKSIVSEFMRYDCLRKAYSYSINSLPNVFSGDNKDIFIQIYQEIIVRSQVAELVNDF